MNEIRVLLIVNEPALQAKMAGFFKERGDAVFTVDSSEQAMAKIAVGNYDLMVVEGLKEDGRALELIHRARVSLPNMVSILLTPHVSRGNIVQALRAHVFDVLQMPLEQFDMFALSIDRATERVRLVRERDHLMDSLRVRNSELEASLHKLNDAYERLMAQEEVLEADLRRAQLMQQNLLPESFPPTGCMEFYGYYCPSERLGGDFFGYLPLGPSKRAVYLADVSGHGVRAAMVTVIVRELLHGHLLQSGDNSILDQPSRTLQFLNHALLDEGFDSPVHATMVYAVIDCERGEVKYCRAGHPAPILCRSNGAVERLHTGGPGLGLEPSPRYRSQKLSIPAGGACLIFSDGVTQAMGARDEDAAAMALGRTLKGMRQERVSRIGEKVERFAVPPGSPVLDDISFLLIRRFAKEEVHAQGTNGFASVKIVSARPHAQNLELPLSRVEMGWEEGICLLRLCGTLTWQLGPAFQEVMEEVHEGRALAVYVDMSECESLDSTMLGLINQYAPEIVLSLPQERVERQLEELGVARRLHITAEPMPAVKTVVRLSPEMTRDERAQMMLEAHESLLVLSEANRERFAPVVDSLRKRHAGE